MPGANTWKDSFCAMTKIEWYSKEIFKKKLRNIRGKIKCNSMIIIKITTTSRVVQAREKPLNIIKAEILTHLLSKNRRGRLQLIGLFCLELSQRNHQSRVDEQIQQKLQVESITISPNLTHINKERRTSRLISLCMSFSISCVILRTALN